MTIAKEGANTASIVHDIVKLENIAKGLLQSVFTARLDVSRDTME